jgi:opacity protein-like surface antigen
VAVYEHPTMRNLLLSALALAALTAAGAASAEAAASGAPAPGSRHAERRQQVFDKIDTNHDGSISRAEYQAWVDARFDKLDANGNGTVDADEVATSRAAVARLQRRAEGFVKRYDTSGTGEVSKTDFESKEMQRFDKLSGGADSLTEEQFDAAVSQLRHRRGAAADGNGG